MDFLYNRKRFGLVSQVYQGLSQGHCNPGLQPVTVPGWCAGGMLICSPECLQCGSTIRARGWIGSIGVVSPPSCYAGGSQK